MKRKMSLDNLLAFLGVAIIIIFGTKAWSSTFLRANPTNTPTAPALTVEAAELEFSEPVEEVVCINRRWCNMPINLPGTYEENRAEILRMLADWEASLSCGSVEDFQVIINEISYGDMTAKEFKWRITDIILLVDRSDCEH